jgi:bifunctional polynucleotide phosphatase/kinase
MPIIQLKLNKFRLRSKIASFDYDWTLVKPKSGGTFPKNEDDWQWLQTSVPKILEEYYKKGFCIIVFTNQTKDWKITQVEKALNTLNLPILILIATDKENHKPSTNMYDQFVKNDKIKLKSSFFVGDALGRPNDWSNTDKLFAESIGFPIKTPEEIFPFDVHNTNNGKEKLDISNVQELVVLVGYPGSGKSHFSTCYFGENDKYVILHGDDLKTSTKMIKAARPLIKNGKSIIFDATNPSKEKRKEYIDIAKELQLSIRCIHISTSFEESLYRNNQRPKEQIVPKIVYYIYRKKFEIPTKDEGFNSIITL